MLFLHRQALIFLCIALAQFCTIATAFCADRNVDERPYCIDAKDKREAFLKSYAFINSCLEKFPTKDQTRKSMCKTIVPFTTISDNLRHVRFLIDDKKKMQHDMIPFRENAYSKPYKMFQTPEQCCTKKATLWCIWFDGHHEYMRLRAMTMKPFGRLEYYNYDKVQRHRLQDDNYDEQSGYNFLLIGNDLYNDPLPEAYRNYLPEQYYTKRSKLWCVRTVSQK
jgi:hypothetical protein